MTELHRTIHNDGTDTSNPTRETYGALDAAYAFFNERLFAGRLPRCLITVRHHGRALGYFAGERFSTRDGTEVTDEIALNPKYFGTCAMDDIMSTLVHEMCHLEQHHFGKPSRGRYHNREWGALMDRVGLTPSHTGKPGGRRTGQQMSHYIVPDGPFARAYAARPFDDLYFDRQKAADGPRKLKTKYTCPGCELNAWAKPGALFRCDVCAQIMVPIGHGVASYETNSW